MLCHDMHQLFLSFPFNFLAMFVCLFEFWFFFSWFHWWIWSISSLPCQWKTHQPFVQADIPVSIISCAKRLCMPLSLIAQGCHRFGFFPPCRLISPAGFSGMEGLNKWTPEGMKLPLLCPRLPEWSWCCHTWLMAVLFDRKHWASYRMLL